MNRIMVLEQVLKILISIHLYMNSLNYMSVLFGFALYSFLVNYCGLKIDHMSINAVEAIIIRSN